MSTSRLYRLGDAFSQVLNVLIHNGDPNHSISGDAYRFKRVRLQKSIDWVFARLPFGWAEENHCKLSHEMDIERGCNLCKKYTNTRDANDNQSES